MGTVARAAYPCLRTPWPTWCRSLSICSTGSSGPVSTSTRSCVARSSRDLASACRSRRARPPSSSRSGAPSEVSGDDPSLGLRIGVAVLPDDDNVVSLAAMHSATLGEGLQRLARYKRLVCPERISIERRRRGEARLRFDWLLADGAAARRC